MSRVTRWQPLHSAAFHGHLPVAKHIVMAHGAETTARTHEAGNKDPIDIASEKGYAAIVDFLKGARQKRVVRRRKQRHSKTKEDL